eukprot:TRINITY_DN65799_c0_g1_i1.p1 TRINITY_DN65799_c0_g1~~TRINITY_DN65799_c0_g1_i1.p1  ORF type:complete len:744 (+),score=164.30 TRINITY_DN65799_c0_g1_i1:97-2232(+)
MGETRLYAILSGGYPDVSLLEAAESCESCIVPPKDLVSPNDLPKLSAVRVLKKRLQTMTTQQEKRIFLDALREALDALRLFESEPQQADVTALPSEKLDKLLDAVEGTFTDLEHRYGDLLKRQKDVDAEWMEMESKSAVTKGLSDPAALTLEGDSAEDRRSGWNKEWSWERRAEFAWALGELEQVMAQREKVHGALRERWKELEAHLATLRTLRSRCAYVDNTYMDLLEGMDPRHYLQSCDKALRDRQRLVNVCQTDLQHITAELDLVRDAARRHKEEFENFDVPGGPLYGELRRQEQELLAALARVPSERESALRGPRDQLSELERSREIEVERALRDSRAFLDRNEQEQEACRQKQQELEDHFKRREAELRQQIERNIARQEEQLERHAREAEERKVTERRRTMAMLRLERDTEAAIPARRATIASAELEQRWVREVGEPLYRSVVITLRSHHGERMGDLDILAAVLGAATARAVGPLAITYGALIHSLIGLAQDVDEMVEACQLHLDFCNETDDPEGADFLRARDSLRSSRDALLTEAHDCRARLQRLLQLWDVLAANKLTHGYPAPCVAMEDALPQGACTEVLALGEVPQRRRVSAKPVESKLGRAERQAAVETLGLQSPRPSTERRRRRLRAKFRRDIPMRGAHCPITYRLPGVWRDPYLGLQPEEGDAASQEPAGATSPTPTPQVRDPGCEVGKLPPIGGRNSMG